MPANQHLPKPNGVDNFLSSYLRAVSGYASFA